MDVGALADQALLIINDIISDKLGSPAKYQDIKSKYEPFRGIADSDKINTELNYILLDYLVPKKYIVSIKNKTSPENNKFKITPDGYSYIHDAQTKRKESNIGFCAMWFHYDTKKAWNEAIKPAIAACSCTPIRIDEVNYNNDINAEMIEKINKSKFVIADFTGNRGGVYFEAGYAKGLQIPVIYTCNEEDWGKQKPHFDVQHQNFIHWNNDELEKFKEQLIKRITISIPGIIFN